jgi:hypothetical protein
MTDIWAKHSWTCILFTISFFIFQNLSLAQSPFNGGLVLGLNASQINGDNAAGFTKLGLKGGIQGVVNMKERWNLVLEFLFSQRGSVDESDYFGQDGIFTEIKLNYFEIPIYVEFLDWKVDDYYKMHFIAGFSYGLLRNASTEGILHQPEDLNEQDYSMLIGIDFFGSRHMGGGARFTYSMNNLYDNGNNNTQYDNLRGYFLSFHTFYRIK